LVYGMLDRVGQQLKRPVPLTLALEAAATKVLANFESQAP
jgi:hypothetical protein